MLDISIDTKSAVKWFDAVANNQLPFATSRAINATASDVIHAERAEMLKVFNAPTAYTLNSMRIVRSNKRRLSALVAIKDRTSRGLPALRYLSPEIRGGERGRKGLTVGLQKMGKIRANEYMVPGAGARLNASGNVTRGWARKVLNDLNAKNNGVFFGTVRGTRGVWRRLKGRVTPLYIVVRKPKYRKRLDFDRVAVKTVNERFNNHFHRFLEAAIRTAK